MATQKVQIGFDVAVTGGDFLTLDDPVKGKLDDATYPLGGIILVDVTERVREFTISRGKSRELDRYDAGEATIEFNNLDRAFDPTYADSPYAGQILPKREVQISSDDIIQFRGFIDDWNLEYTTDGQAISIAVASDDFTALNNRTLSAQTATPQTSGERVNAILDDPEVGFPADKRIISTGFAQLGADEIADDTNALDYLRLIEQTEPGRLFMSKANDLVFKDRLVAPRSEGIVELSDDGTGIKYGEVRVVFGTEQLHNEVVVSSVITGGTAIAVDPTSITEYGILNLTLPDLLMDTTEQASDLAVFLASKYSQPEYRFESVDIQFSNLTPAQQAQILNLELGDVCKVTFTPGNVPPAIVRYAEIIGIQHEVDLVDQIVTLNFSTLDFTYLVLDDTAFGRLDSGNALAF
jgi:hypothetical protein